MAESKRYYWLRLHDDFFNSKRIKKLRKLAGGDTYTIIYLKLQLLAMKHDGVLRYDHLENSFAAEIALDLDEDEINVEVTLNYLLSCGLAETSDSENFFFPYAVENTGSEGSSAKRMRDARSKEKLSPTKENVTLCAQSAEMCALSDGEKEIEKEIELKKEKNTGAEKRKRFVPPSVEDVAEYCESRKNGIDAEEFVSFYSSKGWMIGKNKMTDWKAAVRTWERNRKKDNDNGTRNNGQRQRVGAAGSQSAGKDWGIRYD